MKKRLSIADGVIVAALLVCALSSGTFAPRLSAAAPPPENPQDGSIGVEGRIPSVPPQTAPTITTPDDGQGFTVLPAIVNGLCPGDLLIKLFSNNVFVGSVQCSDGSYTIGVDLFAGRNDLVARAFDAFDQSSPDSNVATVSFSDAQLNPLGMPLLAITSNFARRGANPGDVLIWPIILSGGTEPYAISADWGDGTPPTLTSTSFTGPLELSHTYDKAGTYKLIIRGTDKNGMTAFLQLVAVANGAVIAQGAGEDGATIITKVLWIPALVSIPLLLGSFWLGRRYELAILRKQLEARDRPEKP